MGYWSKYIEKFANPVRLFWKYRIVQTTNSGGVLISQSTKFKSSIRKRIYSSLYGGFFLIDLFYFLGFPCKESNKERSPLTNSICLYQRKKFSRKTPLSFSYIKKKKHERKSWFFATSPLKNKQKKTLKKQSINKKNLTYYSKQFLSINVIIIEHS